MASRAWQRLRKIWISLGLSATVVFVGWSLIAFRAAPAARASLDSDSLVSVVRTDHGWTFSPVGTGDGPTGATLLFLPGGMVDPVAYAPLARRVAAAGHQVHLFRMPWRGAFGQGDGPEFLETVRAAADRTPGPLVLAGHSRGAALAARIAHGGMPRLTGLVLLGTTHPRDFSLAHLRFPVTKVYATSDGIAPESKVRANAHLLPPTTRWVELRGGNHSQFGAYGFQPGDRFATMDRPTQATRIVEALLEALDDAQTTQQDGNRSGQAAVVSSPN